MTPCRVEQIETLVTKASEFYQVDRDKLVIHTKERAACIAREMIWYICKNGYCMTLQCIGEYFSGRNHSTIRRGALTIKREIQVNEDRKQELVSLLTILKMPKIAAAAIP